MGHDDIGRALNQLAGEACDAIGVGISPTVFDLEVLALDPAQLMQRLSKNLEAGADIGVVFRDRHQHANPPYPIARLSYRPARRGCCPTAEQQQIAALHSINSSTRGEPPKWSEAPMCGMDLNDRNSAAIGSDKPLWRTIYPAIRSSNNSSQEGHGRLRCWLGPRSAQPGRPDACRRRIGFHLWTPAFTQGKTLGSLLRV